jgi:hypothetical protein
MFKNGDYVMTAHGNKIGIVVRADLASSTVLWEDNTHTSEYNHKLMLVGYANILLTRKAA